MTEHTLEKIYSFFIWLFTIGFYPAIYWATHKEMVLRTGECKYVLFATYSEFKKAFNAANWILKYNQTNSLFTDDESAYFHADIIRFKEVGMILTPYGLIRAKLYKRKKIKELNKGQTNSRFIDAMAADKIIHTLK